MDERSTRSPTSVLANDSVEKSRRDRDSHREGRHSDHSKSSDARNDKDSRSRREERNSKRRERSRHRSSDRSERKSHDSQLHRERSKKSKDDEGSRRSRRSHSRSSHDNHSSRRSRRSRSHISHGRDRDRDRLRDRDRDRERDRNRERDRGRDRDRERDRKRDSNRSHSGSYERNSRHSSHSWDQEHDRNNLKDISSSSITKEELDQISLEAVREIRDTRFDTNQALQGLISNNQASKNFAVLFNNSNSNDSNSNGPSENSQDGIERKKRKKSRWGGSEHDKTFIPGMPTILPSTLDPTQQEAYLVQLQIEEISRKLRTGELGIPQNPEERSPSPEPIYSSDGKRLNTREFRYRKKLEEQRHNLIQKMNTVNPDFKPPADYKPPITRVIDKVLIPQEQHPDINFVGLLIGPRGNTLKAMEKETGAKIIIRGKGSVKEGKVGRKDGQPLAGEDEPLHAFITASNPEAVKKAVDKIKDIIRQGIEVPEGHNDLRRMQLRELAQLNGTLRETDCPRCTNCGSIEHKSWLCPDKPNVTNNIICIICGGIGHISKDCRSKRVGVPGSESTEDVQAKIDEEYMSLMAELGEGPPTSNSQQKPNADSMSQVHINRGYSIFEKKPINTPAIQGSSTMAAVTSTSVTISTTIPPPIQSMVTPTGPVLPVPTPAPPIPPNWVPPVGVTAPMVLPPLVPPPGGTPKVMPLLSWMNASQPPPPGGDLPPPPGTSPLSPLGSTATLPPLVPPPTSATVLGNIMPPWGVPAPNLMSSNLCSWVGSSTPYIPPPPPPPCIPPPPGIATLPQPPPPPPPLA